MPVKKRALIIGMLGPAIQTIGFVWQGAHIYFYHSNSAFTLRHLAFEPGFLMILIGFIVSFVCVPLATEVAAADESELEIPAFGVEHNPIGGQMQLPGLGGATTMDR